MKSVLLAITSVLLCLMLVGGTALADSPKKAAPMRTGPVLLSEVHSPLERPGTWTSEKMPWKAPEGAKPGDVHADGAGFWWGGYYYDVVTNEFLANNVRRDPGQAFKMLGRGVCMETAETTSLTGSLSISGDAQFSQAIKGSFGFSGSGTRTFTETYKYCAPDSGPYRVRYFYKQLIYNRHRSYVSRMYFDWNGRLHHIDSGSAIVLVPYMGVYTEDVQ